MRRALAPGQRTAFVGLAFGPIALVAGLYFVGRLNLVAIAGSGGDAPRPGVALYGWWFLAVSTIGLLFTALHRRTLAAALFAAAILAQAAALVVLAKRQGSDAPYLALKMFYLLIYPQAVAGAVVAAEAWSRIQRTARITIGGLPTSQQASAGVSSAVAWVLVAMVSIAVARPLAARVPRTRLMAQRPAVSLPLERAGEWAREHIPTGCVEYLVDDDSTAYWLHLVMLGNPRSSARSNDRATYDFRETLLRWLSPDGLPYAIADLRVVPRDIRTDFDVLAQFDQAAVIRHRGRSICR
jgi:hypothetical protein